MIGSRDEVLEQVRNLPPYHDLDHFPYRSRHPRIFGASEFPAIVGENQFESATRWFRRRHGWDPHPVRSHEAEHKMMVGSLCESAILDWYDTCHPEHKTIVRNPDKSASLEYPGLFASADALTAAYPVEVKFTSYWWEEIPSYVIAQMYAQILCTDSVGVILVKARPSSRVLIEFDQELITKTSIEESYPTDIWLERVTTMIDALEFPSRSWHPSWSHKVLEVPRTVPDTRGDRELEKLSVRYRDNLRIQRELESRNKDMRARVIKMVSEKEHNVFETDQVKVSYRNYTSNRIDSKLLKSKFPDIAEECAKVSKQRRLVIE